MSKKKTDAVKKHFSKRQQAGEKRLSVWLTSEQIVKCRKLANERGISFNKMINAAMAEYFEADKE